MVIEDLSERTGAEIKIANSVYDFIKNIDWDVLWVILF